MSRAQNIIEKLEEAMNPKLKKGLKYGAAALGTAGAGYLAYKHGNVHHHLFGTKITPDLEHTTQSNGSTYTSHKVPQPDGTIIEHPRLVSTPEEPSKSAEITSPGEGHTIDHHVEKLERQVKSHNAQHKYHADKWSHVYDEIERKSKEMESHLDLTKPGDKPDHFFLKPEHDNPVSEKIRNNLRGEVNDLDKEYDYHHRELNKHRKLSRSLAIEIRNRKYPR